MKQNQKEVFQIIVEGLNWTEAWKEGTKQQWTKNQWTLLQANKAHLGSWDYRGGRQGGLFTGGFWFYSESREVASQLVFWVKLCPLPPTSYVEVLTPGTSECDLIWRWGLYRGNQVKMRSLGWALIQYDWCPYKKRKLGHRHTQRKEHVKTQGADSWLSPSEGERLEIHPSLPALAHTLILGF